MVGFVTRTRVPGVQGTQNIQASPGLPNPQNNIFIFGNRRNPTNAETNGLPVLQVQAGFPRYEYYKCYQLPSQYINDAFGMLSYFTSCGFTVGYGYSSSQTLLNASHVDITTLASQEQVIVYYLSSAQLIQPLVGSGLSGTFDDTTATVTGNFVSAAIGSFEISNVTYDSYVILNSADFASVAAADNITISFLNYSLLIPDANTTEPFLMNLYQSIIASIIPTNANSTVATPSVYFSILPNTADSGYFGPTSAPFTLSVPTSVSSTTTVFAIPSENVGYVPLTALGNSEISQSLTLPTTATNFVYYANGKFLRLSSANAGIDYSTDGITWTATNKTTGTFTKVYWNSTIFVAVSTAGLWYSADGITWTVTSKSTGSFSDIYFANGKWVAASTVGLWYSADGITAWTACTGATTGIFRSVAYGASKWVATCSVDIYTSTDGITFAALSFSANGFNAVTFANGIFQIGSDTNSGIYYSTDAITITQSNLVTKAINYFYFNGTQWVAATSVGLYYSNNGISWAACTGATTGVFTALIYALNRWVATSSVGIYNSADGITFAISTGATTGNFLSVAANSTLIVAGSATGLKSSLNGSTWSVNNTASGIITSAVINSGSLIVTLNNITGTFNASDVCTLTLDPTQLIFNSQRTLFANTKQSLQQLALPYAINSNTDINTTYKPAFDYVAALNEPATSQDGQAICQIVFGNISIPENQAVLDLPTAVNNFKYEPVYYNYNPIVGELPLSVGQLTAAYAMVVGSNVVPLNPQAGVVINGLPVASDSSKYIGTQVGGVGDQIMLLGWNVITVNNQAQAYVINPITGQTTLPNLPTPDNEFFAEYVWQTVDYLRKGVTNICLNIGLGQVRQTPKILSTLKSNIISFMLDMQDGGMLLNVIANEAFITIVQDPNNPLGVDIVIPAQIVPGLENIYYTINIFSSTIQLQAAA